MLKNGLFFTCLFSLAISAFCVQAEEGEEVFTPHVQVSEQFVEWRSGPAAGYPVVNISEKGDWLQLGVRKTSWIKVSNPSGEEGWVHIDDLLAMQDSNQEPLQLSEPRFDDFGTRKWEAGLLSGEFDRSALMNIYAGYWFTPNISSELHAQQVLSDSSELIILTANLLHQPFPAWRVSPFFSIGAGKVFINPKATLSDLNSRNEEMVSAGFGLRYYLDDRYFIRAEVRDYKIFTNRESNEEATEWKIGLSVFF